MLDLDKRTAVLVLNKEGHGVRSIARTLRVSRKFVRSVLASGSAQVPTLERDTKLDPYLEDLQDLFVTCQGNRVRVYEKLLEKVHGVSDLKNFSLEEHGESPFSYASLTRFCRQHGIGIREKQRAGRYHFLPGEEMQHDTSPHEVEVGGRFRKLTCASIVLCYSRMIYGKVYTRFTRFWAKVFLTEAIQFFEGSAETCMVDNTNLVVACGTGAKAVIVPEMVDFGDRFSFKFAAHELGHADRKARVERPFRFIERNFYPGRTFTDLDDLNRQFHAWCIKVNGKPKKRIKARPIDLYQTERTSLRPLPAYIPPIYVLTQNTVDLEGYVHVCTNRYSVPEKYIDNRLQVRAEKDRIRIFSGHELVAEHQRLEDGLGKRQTLPEHRHPGSWRRRINPPPLPEETLLRAQGEEFVQMIEALRKTSRGRGTWNIKRLHRMFLDYPTSILKGAIATALAHGLHDLDRIEKMVLGMIEGDFFRISLSGNKNGEEDSE